MRIDILEECNILMSSASLFNEILIEGNFANNMKLANITHYLGRNTL